jgi:hypothetical protein
LGQITMIVQCIAVGGVLWIHAFPWPAVWREGWVIVIQILVWITLLTTVGSGASYVLKARKILGGVS